MIKRGALHCRWFTGVICNQPSLTEIHQPNVSCCGDTHIYPKLRTHQRPSHRASRWRTWLADEGPEPSGAVMVVSLGNLCSNGTNVKVKGTPSKTWQERATNRQPSTYTHTHTHDFGMEDNWVTDLLAPAIIYHEHVSERTIRIVPKIEKWSAVILLVFTWIAETMGWCRCVKNWNEFIPPSFRICAFPRGTRGEHSGHFLCS